MAAASPPAHDSETQCASMPAADGAPEESAEPAYERVDLDRYVVLRDGPVGYVESVPPVFVCYVGYPYAQADEIAQVHDFHDAVTTVVDHAVSSGHSKITA